MVILLLFARVIRAEIILYLFWGCLKIILMMIFLDSGSSSNAGRVANSSLTYIFYWRSAPCFYLLPLNILRPLFLHQFDSAGTIHQATSFTFTLSLATIKYLPLWRIVNIHPTSNKISIDIESAVLPAHQLGQHFSCMMIRLLYSTFLPSNPNHKNMDISSQRQRSGLWGGKDLPGGVQQVSMAFFPEESILLWTMLQYNNKQWGGVNHSRPTLRQLPEMYP